MQVMVDDDVSAVVRAQLNYFMDHYDGNPTPVQRAFDSLTANDPRRDRKVRGLVQLIAILPEYQIN